MRKKNIELKECNETLYWLEPLEETNYIEETIFSSLKTDTEEHLKLLIATVKTTKQNLKNSLDTKPFAFNYQLPTIL